MKKVVFSIVIFFFSINILFSQNIEMTKNGRLIHLESKSIQGLNTNLIYTVVADKNGFIWIHSKLGINRFNGRKFETIGWELGIPKKEHLFRDDLGNVWFIDRREAIKYNGKSYEIFNFPDSVYDKTDPETIISTIQGNNPGDFLVSLHSFVKKTATFMIKFCAEKISVIDLSLYKLPSYPVVLSLGAEETIWIYCKEMDYRAKRFFVFKNENLRLLKIDKKLTVTENRKVIKDDFGDLISIQQSGKKTYFFFKNKILLYSNRVGFSEKDNLIKKRRYAVSDAVRLGEKIFVTIKRKNSGVKSLLQIESGRWKEVVLLPDNFYLEQIYVKNKELFIFEKWQQEAKLFKFEKNRWVFIDKIPFPGEIHPVEGSDFHFIESLLPRPRTSLYSTNLRRALKNPFNLLVADISLGKQGNIWIRFIDQENRINNNFLPSGIACWDGVTLQKYSTQNGLLSNQVNNIFCDSSGNVWALSHKGISLGQKKNNSFSFKVIYRSTNFIAFDRHLEVKPGMNFFWKHHPPGVDKSIKSEKTTLLGFVRNEHFQNLNLPEATDPVKIISLNLFYTTSGKLLLTIVQSPKNIISNYFYNLESNQWANASDAYKNLIAIGKSDQYDYYLQPKSKKIISYKESFKEVRGVKDTTIFNLKNGLPGAFFETKYGLIFQGEKLTKIKGNNVEAISVSADIEHFYVRDFFKYLGGYIFISWLDDHYFFDGTGLYPISKDEDYILSDKNENLFLCRGNWGIGSASEFFTEELSDFLPGVYISSIQTDSAFYHLSDSLYLAYGENYITINTGVKDYYHPFSVYYSYFLEGFDKRWSDFENNSVIRYKNLPEGKYRLNINTFNFTGQSYHYKSDEFTILPPWYRSTGAYSFFCFLFFGIILSMFAIQRRILRNRHEYTRQRDELEFGRSVQLSMLPDHAMIISDFQIYGDMQTASEVGGDFYDFLTLDDKTVAISVGDATGHGVGAGMMVGMAKSAVTQALTSIEGDIEPAHVLIQINKTLGYAMKTRGLGMCFSLAIIDVETGMVKLASSGLPFPYHYQTARTEIQALRMTGPPLGLISEFPFEQKEIVMEEGDSLIFLSDGYPERMNPNGEFWDYEQMEVTIKKILTSKPDCDEFVNKLKKANEEFSGGRPNDDDMTVVVIKRSKRKEDLGK